MKRLMILSLSAVMVAALALPAAADQQRRNDRNPDRTVVTRHHTNAPRPQAQHRNRYSVGHRFNRHEVVVLNDWQRRGLHRPGRGQVYVYRGNDIYLVAAATLAILGLSN